MNYDMLESQLADTIKTNLLQGRSFQTLDSNVFTKLAMELKDSAADYRVFVHAKPLFEVHPTQDVLIALKAHFVPQYYAHRPILEFLDKALRETPASVSLDARVAISLAKASLAGHPCAAENLGLLWLNGVKSSNLMAEYAVEKTLVREAAISATYSDDYEVRSREGAECRLRDDALKLMQPVFEDFGFSYVPKAAPSMAFGRLGFSSFESSEPVESLPQTSLDRLAHTLLKFGEELQAEHIQFKGKVDKIVDYETPKHGWGPRGNIFYAQAKQLFLSIDRPDLRSLKVELMEIKNQTLDAIRGFTDTPGVSRSIQTQEVMASYQKYLKIFDRAHAEYHVDLKKPAPALSLTAGM